MELPFHKLRLVCSRVNMRSASPLVGAMSLRTHNSSIGYKRRKAYRTRCSNKCTRTRIILSLFSKLSREPESVLTRASNACLQNIVLTRASFGPSRTGHSVLAWNRQLKQHIGVGPWDNGYEDNRIFNNG